MDLYSLLDSWYMVGWLLGAGCVLRCGAFVFEKAVETVHWLFSSFDWRKEP